MNLFVLHSVSLSVRGELFLPILIQSYNLPVLLGRNNLHFALSTVSLFVLHSVSHSVRGVTFLPILIQSYILPVLLGRHIFFIQFFRDETLL